MTCTLAVVSHTHLDREWYQPFQEYRIRLVQLTDRLLDLLARDPGYRYFTFDGQTIILEDYLQVRPEQEATLRRYVQEGRLLIGPWYVPPDEFLVSPEATIRNLISIYPLLGGNWKGLKLQCVPKRPSLSFIPVGLLG